MPDFPTEEPDGGFTDEQKEEAHRELMIRSDLLRMDLLELAKKHYYREQYDDDSQLMFALACDVVRASAYTDAVLPVGPLYAADGEAAAETLGPIVANVCPGWTIQTDSHRQDYPDLEDGQNRINGHLYEEAPTVPATQKLLGLIQDSEFEVMDDFHPGANGSITLVDRASNSAITLLIFESDDT